MYVVCAGILVADIFSSPVDVVPAEGQLVLADAFMLNAGGCAVNTAACLRGAGIPARVIGKVGRDLFGDLVIGDLERLGIDPSGVERSDTHPTSSTFILNVKGEDRRYVHVIGANGDLRADSIDIGALVDARVLYVGGYLAMPAFDCAGLTRLFQEARARSILTVLDVIISAERRVPLDAVRSALPYTDVFLPNEDEARALTGKTSAREQVEALSEMAPGCAVVVTRGKQGVLAKKGSEGWEIGVYPVKTVDESGAGDAFAAALGASCTRALGCTAGVFRREEALAFIENTRLDVRRFVGGKDRVTCQ